MGSGIEQATSPATAAKAGRRRMFLMRHGHVDYATHIANGGDVRTTPLSDEGAAQASAAAEALSETSFDIALCSGLPRTVSTAELVLRRQDGPPPLEEEPQLEELRGGWAEASGPAEMAARIAYAFDAAGTPGASFLEGGETFASAYGRVSDALYRIVTTGAWSRALVVAHEGVNRIALGWACGGGLASISAFEQDLACVNVIDFDVVPEQNGQGLKIERTIMKAVNLTPYDYLKHGMARTSLEIIFDL